MKTHTNRNDLDFNQEQKNRSLDHDDGTKSQITHINNMWVPGQPLPLCDMTKAEINLSVDWITCTFYNKKILSELTDLKPLEESDAIEIDQDPEENPYIKQGLKISDTKIKFWTQTFDWFKGAKVSIGMYGQEKGLVKDNMVMISLTGKALLHLRKKYHHSSIDILMWLYTFMFEDSYKDEVGHFTRIDFAIDVLPKNSMFSLLEHVFTHNNRNAYTTTARNGGAIKSIFHKTETGNLLETVYVGSRKSETFARIYDKRREQIALGNKDPKEEWHRFELETKQERAQKLAARLIEAHRNGDRWTVPLLRVIKRFLNFRDLDDCMKLTRVKNASTAYWWEHILLKADPLKLSSKRPQCKPSNEVLKMWISQIQKRLAKIIILRSATAEDTQGILNKMLEDGLGIMTKDEKQDLIDYVVEEQKDVFQERCDKARDAISGLKKVYKKIA